MVVAVVVAAAAVAVAGAVRSVEGEDEEHDRGAADHRGDVRQHHHAQNHLETLLGSHFRTDLILSSS